MVRALISMHKVPPFCSGPNQLKELSSAEAQMSPYCPPSEEPFYNWNKISYQEDNNLLLFRETEENFSNADSFISNMRSMVFSKEKLTTTSKKDKKAEY